MADSGERRRRKGCPDNPAMMNQRIVLNVGGKRFDTYLGTLKNIPHTRLCWLAERHPYSPEYDQTVKEYFFDRHPGIFCEVLNYYRTGKLHCPTHICVLQYTEELAFWGINSRNMESCCWVHYHNLIKKEKSLQGFVKDDEHENNVTAMIDVQPKTIRLTHKVGEPAVAWKKYRKLAWKILDNPNSSKASKVSVI